jgi:excinuclease UvrABC nuclease subunit
VQDIWHWPALVVSLAKEPDRLCWVKDGNQSTPIEVLGEGGQLLQRLRDEAHRFSKRHAHIRLNKRPL